MKRFIGLSIIATLAFGCGDDDVSCPEGFVPTADGTACMLPGGDAGTLDAGTPDTGNPVFDAGPGEDSGPDIDAGPEIDAGPASCDDYAVRCQADRPCIDPNHVCQPEFATTLGGGSDPIMNAPAGTDPLPQTFFVDGMCTPRGLTDVNAPEACDPDDDDDTSCGNCGGCANITGTQSMCLRSCEPSTTDNDVCRDNYSCSLTQGLCVPFGCTDDNGCRVTREDTNGVPGIQTPDFCMRLPAQCAGGAMNFDALVYDTDSTATCNTETYECEGQPSDPAASGGDECTIDADCEDGGRCIQEGGSCTTNGDVDCVTDDQCTAAITGAATDGTCDVTWIGGACIKLGCDVVGNECANDGVCQERGLGVTACLEGCTMGDGADPMDPATWVNPTTGNGGCRENYSCFWNGVGGHGVANNGVCLPSTFNDVAESNTGAPCDTSDECFGPFGQARCLRLDPLDEFGFCTVNDCTAPFFDMASTANVCGGDNPCINFGDATDPFGLCLQDCTTGDDCTGSNIACREDVVMGINVCFPGCSTTEQCPTGQTCEGATAMESGICTPAG